MLNAKVLSSDTPDEIVCPGRAPFKNVNVGYNTNVNTYGGTGLSTQTNDVPIGYNNAIIKWHSGDWVRHVAIVETRIKSPTLALINGDTYNSNTIIEKNVAQWMIAQTDMAGSYNTDRNHSGTFSVGAHGNQGNFLFLDGHAESFNSAGTLRARIRECCDVQGEAKFNMALFGPNGTFHPYSAD